MTVAISLKKTASLDQKLDQGQFMSLIMVGGVQWWQLMQVRAANNAQN